MTHALVLLCGGLSTRMGTNKAFLPFGEYTLIEYQVRRFRPNFEKIYLNIGINFKNMVVNSYVIGILNLVFGFFIAKNIDRIKLNDVKYNTYISKNIFSADIYSIINFNLVHTIIILIKLIFRVRKVDKDYGKRTSNRKSYDDCYDIT